MRKLVIELDDDVFAWVERRRGSAEPEAYAGRALRDYMTMEENGVSGRFARAHEEMADQLSELQQRIRRLDESLRASAARPGREE